VVLTSTVVSLQLIVCFLVLISRVCFDYWPIILYLFQLIVGNELQIYVNCECELGREVGFVAVWRC